jgi:valyl-tRNA synthetase
MDDYSFGEAGRQLYEFFWSEFADWYIEIAKIRLYGTDARAQATVRRILVYVLDRVLQMLHPYMPFVTEVTWQHLPKRESEALMITEWPPKSHTPPDEKAEAQMLILIEVIRAIRNIRSEYNVEPGKRIPAYVAAGEHVSVLIKHSEILTSLARLDEDSLQMRKTLAEKIEIYLPLAGMIDLQAERERMQKELAQLDERIATSQTKLGNTGFIQKAPAAIVQKEREKLADLELQAAKIQERLKDLA